MKLAVEPKVLRSKSKNNVEPAWVDQKERTMAANMIS